MFLSSREKKIVNLLLNNRRQFTTAQIAAELKVNQRTIKTDIRKINSELEKNSCRIQAKRGAGVWLECESEGEDFLREFLRNNSDSYIPAEIRKYYIASEILNYKGYVSMEQLANHFYVSKATVLNDVNDLTEFLEKFEIRFTKKVKHGVRAEGNERQIRRGLFGTQKHIVEYFSAAPVDRLQILYPDMNLNLLADIIRQTENKFHFILTETSFHELLIRIGIMLQRVRKGCLIEAISPSTKIQEEKEGWSIREFLREQFWDHVHCQVPDPEMDEILINLKRLRFQVPLAETTDSTSFTENEWEMYGYMREVLREIDSKYLLELEADEEFTTALFGHLNSMVQRVKGQMYLENPLLETVKGELSYEYEIASYIIGKFNAKYDIKATDNEIGYITFHVGAAIERAEERKARKHTVTLVCMTGMGTSQFISIKLKRRFPHLTVKQIVSESMARTLKKEDQDFVISTVPLKLSDIDVLPVSIVLNDQDVMRITQYLAKKDKASDKADSIYSCLKEFLFEEISIIACDLKTREEVIQLLGNRMRNEGYVDEEYVNSVFERERISDTYMGSLIAVPHAFLGHVLKQGIGILTLKKPISWGDGQVRIVFMLALDAKTENEILQKIFKAVYNLVHNLNDVDKLLKADRLEKIKKSLI